MDILSSKAGTGNLFRKPEMNWGIISTARIAEQIIPAIKSTRHNQVIAVASRDLTRARQFADKMQIPVSYGSYDELLADSTIQAVYIPLPNNEHMPWTIKALQAGKHVLVEKPFALNADEAQQMIGTAVEKSLVLMENFMYRYHSRFQKALEVIKNGEIGKIRFINSSFSFPLENPDDIRLVPNLGGGALYDLGCYCINLQRLLVGREPLSAQAQYHEGGSGVDLQMQAMLDFGDQTYGSFSVAFTAAGQQTARVVGTEGVLSLDWPFAAKNKDLRLTLEKGDSIQNINYREENTYAKVIDHFYQVAIRKEIALYPLADAVKNLIVSDALFQSAIDNSRLVCLNN